MNKEDLSKLLGICKGRMRKGENLEDIEKFILDTQGKKVLSELHNELKQHANRKGDNYWIILCNPLTWYEGTNLYEVNDLLKEVNKKLDKEFWKINGKTVYPQIKVGDRGIIKVGEDKRKLKDRIDENGEIVDKLNAGIYATFEVIKDEERKSHKKQVEKESFVCIRVIDNFFKKNKIINKDKAIELLGKTTFQTKSSKKIEKFLYTKIKNEFYSSQNSNIG